MRSLALLSALGSLALTSAHFTVDNPEPIGEANDPETAPCGGNTPDISEGSDQLVDVHVGGEAFALKSTHPRSTWLFRATLDEEAVNGWEGVYPQIVQSGLGDFCIPKVTFNESWAGQRGVISIVALADDGVLYNCVAANFVEGTGEPPSSCNNASSISDSYETNEPELDALLGDQDESDSGDSGTEDNTDAAHTLQAWSATGLGGALTALTMCFLGGALMI